MWRKRVEGKCQCLGLRVSPWRRTTPVCPSPPASTPGVTSPPPSRNKLVVCEPLTRPNPLDWDWGVVGSRGPRGLSVNDLTNHDRRRNLSGLKFRTTGERPTYKTLTVTGEARSQRNRLLTLLSRVVYINTTLNLIYRLRAFPITSGVVSPTTLTGMCELFINTPPSSSKVSFVLSRHPGRSPSSRTTP